jgi:hypothetical protein
MTKRQPSGPQATWRRRLAGVALVVLLVNCALHAILFMQ